MCEQNTKISKNLFCKVDNCDLGKIMDTNKENGAKITEMMKNVAVDPNLGHHLDVRV